MNITGSKLTGSLAAGASLAVISFAVLNTMELQPWQTFEGASGGNEQEQTVLTEPEVVVVTKPMKDEKRLEIAGVEENQEFDDASSQGVSSQARSQAKPLSEDKAERIAQVPAASGVLSSPVANKAVTTASQSMGAPKIVAEIAPVPAPVDAINPYYRDQGRDRFEAYEDNPVKRVEEAPVSTFSADVDTASYAFVRSSLNQGHLPPKDAVRAEEMINYFDYDYRVPETRDVPFLSNVALMQTPWNADTKLMRIGIKGYEVPKADIPSANLVFLIDTSGSMNAPDKLPLLRNAFRLLVSSLKPDDRVSIVTYAGSAGTVLEPTPVSQSAKILAALDRLSSGGSTAGAEGIRQAYQLAEQNLDREGINRVILATDGDFNVGITDVEELKGYVERKRERGVTLSVLGFGRGNYNDELMQALAQNGDGNAAYIDTLNEARKVLVDEAGSTLFPIAKDVKLQVEFNPAAVSEYRLIGYETRALAREDFNNDKVDAGDIGAGHTVTALYELRLAGAGNNVTDPLRYGDGSASSSSASGAHSNELGFVKIRYKLPGETKSRLIESPVVESEVSVDGKAAGDLRFAAAVAAFAQQLKGGKHTGDFGYDEILALASGAKGDDPFGYRAEFINLVRLAKSAAALEPLKP